MSCEEPQPINQSVSIYGCRESYTSEIRAVLRTRVLARDSRGVRLVSSDYIVFGNFYWSTVGFMDSLGNQRTRINASMKPQRCWSVSGGIGRRTLSAVYAGTVPPDNGVSL